MPKRVIHIPGRPLPPKACNVSGNKLGCPFEGPGKISAFATWLQAENRTAADIVEHEQFDVVLAGDDERARARNGRRIAARIAARLHLLRGWDLACTCGPNEPCHADLYLFLANREEVTA